METRRDIPPNILWIIADQCCADHFSALGRKSVHTPAVDKLIRTGLTFSQAYCPQALCVPSRTSMLTGLMPHTTGVTRIHPNSATLNFEGRSVGRHLSDAGYRTGYFGRWHTPKNRSDNNWHGFEVMRTQARGLDGNEPFTDKDCAPACESFLESSDDRPFFLTYSLNNPHDICEWGRFLEGGFPTEQMELWNGPIGNPPKVGALPPLPNNHEIPKAEPEIISAYRRRHKGLYPGVDWDDDTWRKYLWGYDRLVERMDRDIDRILQLLEQRGLDENTVILFTSDHGDGRAAHKANQKTILYDEVARVPLIIVDPHCPETKGRVERERLVQSGTDIFHTFLDYAGTPVAEETKKRSLRPRSEPTEFIKSSSNYVTSEAYLGGSDDLPDAYGRMLRTERYKYIVYSHGENREQLFDLRLDPGELNDLSNAPGKNEVLNTHRKMLYQDCEAGNDFFLPFCVHPQTNCLVE